MPSLFMENRLFMSTTALRDIDTPGGQCPITINLRKFLSMKNNDKTNPNTETKLPQVNGSILPCQISNLGTLYSYLSIKTICSLLIFFLKPKPPLLPKTDRTLSKNISSDLHTAWTIKFVLNLLWSTLF